MFQPQSGLNHETALETQNLADRWNLAAGTGQRLQDLLRLLATSDWAPTAVTEPSVALNLHVADSLSGLRVDALRAATRTVDVGSGAGFPGLVLAIALPEARFDLIEAGGKKCQFIERATNALSLANVTVVHDRAESWAGGEGSGAYDAVTVRAVGSLPTLIEYASPLLKQGGVMVAWKGRGEQGEELAAAKSAVRLAMSPVAVMPVCPYPASRDRHLHVYQKTGPTPEGIPRRPGMAAKRPRG